MDKTPKYKNMNLLKFVLKLKGFPIFRAEKKLQSILSMNKKEKIKYQDKAAWDIFDFHKKNNPYYQKFLGKSQIQNWNDIPIIKKKDFQKIMSIDSHLFGNYKNSTSGSTGIPFNFSKDKYCQAMCWAMIFHRFGLHNVSNGYDLQARFYGIPLEKKKFYREKLKDLLSSRYRFNIFSVDDNLYANHIRKFKNNSFVFVNGYTNSIVMFSKYCINNNIVIKEICPSLKCVFTTSEVCDDIDKNLIIKAFGVKVVNEYGAAELDLIGFEDDDGDWLLNYETLKIEIVDDNDNILPLGKAGRIIVTSLYNKSSPFIRYDLGDIVTLKKESKGNYNLINQVEGRKNDIIILPNGKKSMGLTFYYIAKKILSVNITIKEFIIRQKTITHFDLIYVGRQKINKKEKVDLQKSIEKYLCKGLNIDFVRVHKIERTSAGKFKHFFSDLDYE